MAPARRVVLVVIGAAFFLLAAGLAIRVVIELQSPPSDGPEPIAWNQTRCAFCRMHVGDPAFAGQIITPEGDILNFDDPGCLLLYEARAYPQKYPQEYKVWLHHWQQPLWLTKSEAGFVRIDAQATPMGHGLGAVRRDQAGAMSYAAALAYAQQQGVAPTKRTQRDAME